MTRATDHVVRGLRRLVRTWEGSTIMGQRAAYTFFVRIFRSSSSTRLPFLPRDAVTGVTLPPLCHHSVQWEGGKESQKSPEHTTTRAQEQPGWVSTHLFLCFIPTTITSFADTGTGAGGGEGYVWMFNDSVESVKVIYEEKCWSAVKNIAFWVCVGIRFSTDYQEH